MADPAILTDAAHAYVASMTDAEFASFTAAVREPSATPQIKLQATGPTSGR